MKKIPVLTINQDMSDNTIQGSSKIGAFLFHIRFLSSWLDNIPIWNKNTLTG